MSIFNVKKIEPEVDISNIIYSRGYSRPSKSLLSPEIYNQYKIIKDSFNLFDDLKHCLLNECMNYLFSDIINVYENVYILDGKYYKVVEFHDKKFNNITNYLNDKYTNYIIKSNDIHTYPKIQYIYILTAYFKTINICMSKISNFIVVECSDRIKKLNFELNKEMFIKDFNIKVDDDTLKFLKQDNDSYFLNIINLNNKVSTLCQSLSQISNLNREMFTINKYYKSLINKSCGLNCECRPNSIFYSDILECYICENCLILTAFKI